MPFTLQIPDSDWEDSGPDNDPTARLLAAITLNGCPMHLEAYAVIEDATGQRFEDEAFIDQENAVLSVLVDGAARTVEINGRDYVLVATPAQA
jgi:hypothetical protein